MRCWRADQVGKMVAWRKEVQVLCGSWRRVVERRFEEGSEVESGLKGVVREGVRRELR